MSIIIKGMDMPKDGDYIFSFASDENGNNTIVLITDSRTGKAICHKGVVSIPTTHGRLIDADQITLECQWCSLDDAPTILEAETKPITFYDKPIGDAKEMPTTTSAHTILESED